MLQARHVNYFTCLPTYLLSSTRVEMDERELHRQISFHLLNQSVLLKIYRPSIHKKLYKNCMIGNKLSRPVAALIDIIVHSNIKHKT